MPQSKGRSFRLDTGKDFEDNFGHERKPMAVIRTATVLKVQPVFVLLFIDGCKCCRKTYDRIRHTANGTRSLITSEIALIPADLLCGLKNRLVLVLQIAEDEIHSRNS